MKEELIQYGKLEKTYQIIKTIEMVLLVLGIITVVISAIGLVLSQTLYSIGFVTLCLVIFPVIPIMKAGDHIRWNMIKLKRELRIDN